MPKAGGKPQTGRFYEGVFKVTQIGLGDEPRADRAAGLVPRRRGRSAAATKKKQRHLWGDGKGSFRTSGKYSSATVRGTKWLVKDSCAGTLTRVVRGTVTVRDKVRARPSRCRRARATWPSPGAESREQRRVGADREGGVVVAGESEHAVAGGGQRGVLGAVVC